MTMLIRRLPAWPTYFPRVRRPAAAKVWPGPRRMLSLDEQLEIQRAMREAPVGKRRHTARTLATRYGVSLRTVDRYAARPAAQYDRLPFRIQEWARDRNIRLTFDDVAALVAVLTREYSR